MKFLIAILLLLPVPVLGQHFISENVSVNTDASFRGLSVVDAKVAWVSGTKGTVGRSVDGARTWKFEQAKGFEKADFRSLYAFDSLNAIIANAGAPACILRTSDGGQNWDITYKNDDTAMFFDGVDFWNNKEGMIYGDPIGGHILLLSTNDGGHSWKILPLKSRPLLEKGEASFAASGTGIRCVKNNKLIFVTGGTESRFFISDNKGATWRFARAPIIKGTSTTGIFSVAYRDNTAILVGGDYKRDTWCKDNVCVLQRNNKVFLWRTVSKPTRGYRECVEYIIKNTLIAAGPTGMDISRDMGIHWQPLSDEQGYHVVRQSRKGNLLIAVGSKISIVAYR